MEKVYLVVCGCLWLFAGGLWSFAGGLWSFAGGLVLHSYTLHSQSYRNHVKEILENFKVPLRVNLAVFFFLKIPKWQLNFVWDYKPWKSVSCFLINAAKKCLHIFFIFRNMLLRNIRLKMHKKNKKHVRNIARLRFRNA